MQRPSPLARVSSTADRDSAPAMTDVVICCTSPVTKARSSGSASTRPGPRAVRPGPHRRGRPGGVAVAAASERATVGTATFRSSREPRPRYRPSPLRTAIPRIVAYREVRRRRAAVPAPPPPDCPGFLSGPTSPGPRARPSPPRWSSPASAPGPGPGRRSTRRLSGSDRPKRAGPAPRRPRSARSTHL
jgi:hypothetical protein